MLANSTVAVLSTRLHVRVVETDQQLADLAKGWNRLSQAVPLRSWDWMEAWWRHYRQPGDRLCVLAVYDLNHMLVGLAPWYQSQHWAKGRVIRFLGTGEVCSDHLTLLCVPGLEAPIATAVARWLAHDAAGAWDLLELDGVDGRDTAIELLIAALARYDYQAERRVLPAAWRVALPPGWEAYLKNFTKNRRKVTKKAERLASEPGVRRRRVELPHELHQGMRILKELHQKRRQSLGEPGCFSSPRYEAFHREVARRLLERRALRLEWLELDGKPASVTYDLLGGDTVYGYQGGMDPALLSHGLGSVQLVQALRGAIDDGYSYYDFLRGNETYKALWQGVPQPLERVCIAANHFAARMRKEACRRGRKARQQLRSLGERIRPSREPKAESPGLEAE